MSASGSAAPPGSPAPVTPIKLARSRIQPTINIHVGGARARLPLPDGPEEEKQHAGGDPGVYALQAVPEHPLLHPQA